MENKDGEAKGLFYYNHIIAVPLIQLTTFQPFRADKPAADLTYAHFEENCLAKLPKMYEMKVPLYKSSKSEVCGKWVAGPWKLTAVQYNERNTMTKKDSRGLT